MRTENKTTLLLHGKTIQLFCAPQAAPLVVYHAVMGEGEKLWRTCQKNGCPPFSLAVINGINWDDEMTPWPIPPISKHDTPCRGCADTYLKELTNEFLPQVADTIPSKPEYCVLAGYSLAGLFAVYAAYKTDCFSRIVSASGSLWYPDFVPFARQNRISEKIEAIYLSLGDLESHTKNPYLVSVEENTLILADRFSGQGIRNIFQMNKGNHYHDSVGRMAKGIQWALQQQF